MRIHNAETVGSKRVFDHVSQRPLGQERVVGQPISFSYRVPCAERSCRSSYSALRVKSSTPKCLKHCCLNVELISLSLVTTTPANILLHHDMRSQRPRPKKIYETAGFDALEVLHALAVHDLHVTVESRQ